MRNGSRALWLIACACVAAGCTTLKPPPRGSDVAPRSYPYESDGPPDVVPDNLASIPDAVPQDEPFHRFANRPYTVFGRTYVPVVDKQARKERGLASWYGRKFHGQRTASGETYDMFAMTAAHKTMPIPSYARVTHLKNGKSVVVRINDRGPFHGDRIIDLSYAAAQRIGMVAAGSALVEVERVFPGQEGTAALASAAPLAPPVQMPSVETPLVSRENAALWLQLGAFSSAEAAENFRERVARELPWILEPIAIAHRDGLHRVRVGPFRNTEEATAVGDKVRRSIGVAPLVTTR